MAAKADENKYISLQDNIERLERIGGLNLSIRIGFGNKAKRRAKEISKEKIH